MHVNLICAQKTNREHIEKHGEHIIGKYALRVKVEHHLIGAGGYLMNGRSCAYPKIVSVTVGIDSRNDMKGPRRKLYRQGKEKTMSTITGWKAYAIANG